ncbi:MAG: SUMF1/EgtB/PvdO family nonheme iron enzyme [Marinobacter sp.]|nr:SUMF1/EgtB/PvdO family nonheme iron enzyme [Marinobacter sp.]
MRYAIPLIVTGLMAGCTSISSESLSEAEIEDIKERVEERHPDLSLFQQQAVTELVVRAMDNMVFVEGGSFMMGEFGVPCEPGSEALCHADIWPDNDHLHEVTLDDFYLSKYETTLGDFDLYREVMGKEPYAPELRSREDRQHLFEPNLPAWTKEWQEVKDYCLWIGKLANKSVDLPTEAQWEYAARNRGQNVLFATDNGQWSPGENSPSDDGQRQIHAVGSYPPNSHGLHDMTSNSAEWINDWYSKTYYQSSPSQNPTGPASGEFKVVRSGGFNTSPKAITTILRDRSPIIEEFYYRDLGFRCAQN